MDAVSLLPDFPRRTAFQAELRAAVSSSSSLLSSAAVAPLQQHIPLTLNTQGWRTSSRRQVATQPTHHHQLPSTPQMSTSLPLKRSRLGLVSQRRGVSMGQCQPRRGWQPALVHEVDVDTEYYFAPQRCQEPTHTSTFLDSSAAKEHTEDEEDCCPICLDSLPATTATTHLPCQHRLHDSCMQLLLDRGFAHCPLCKRSMTTASPVKAGSCTLPMALHSESGDEGPSEESEDDVYCEVCGGGHQPEELLLCDRCDHGYHMFCLVPALLKVPEGNWYCPRCSKLRARAERRRMAAVPAQLVVTGSDSDSPVVVRRPRSSFLICDDDSE
eukprot:GGOE01003747.1.p1 GENE.GGOE01003747.1~~GGOE01003747.1.p1  ORF type:complete len:327 (-),score=28.01 GGOE01003747.1:415-1395(-)